MKYITITCCLLFALSCKKSNNASTPATPAYPTITGIRMTDNLGNPTDSLGTPNVRLTHGQFTMFDFPEPAVTSARCAIMSSKDSGQVTLILVAGKYSGSLPDGSTFPPGVTLHTPEVNNLTLLGQTTPVFTYTSKFVSGSSQALIVNTIKDTMVPNGFYKMTAYITTATGEDTLWDNVWVNHQ